MQEIITNGYLSIFNNIIVHSNYHKGTPEACVSQLCAGLSAHVCKRCKVSDVLAINRFFHTCVHKDDIRRIGEWQILPERSETSLQFFEIFESCGMKPSLNDMKILAIQCLSIIDKQVICSF